MIYAKDVMDTDYATCQEKDSLAKAMAKMDSEHESYVLVFKEKECVGAFQPAFVTRINNQIDETEVSNFMKKTKMVAPNATEDEMISELSEAGTTILAVEEAGEVVGIVHALDILRDRESLSGLKVKDAAGKSVKSMKETEGIGKAINELFDQKTKALVLTDGEGKGVATLSHYDVLRNIHFFSRSRDHGGKGSEAFRKEKDDYQAIPAFEFTRYREQATIDGDEDALSAVRLMKERNTHAILIEGTDRAITIKDLYRHTANTTQEEPAVEIVGLGELAIDTMTKDAIKQIARKTAVKLAQITGHQVSLRVHIKSYKDAQKDKHHKFSVSAHLTFPGEALTVDKAFDWDAKKAVQIAMEDLENRVANQYRAPKRGTARHR